MQAELFPAGELLFKVIAQSHEYLIYSNGRVQGFGDDDVKIINNYPRLLLGHLQQAQDEQCQDANIQRQHVHQ